MTSYLIALLEWLPTSDGLIITQFPDPIKPTNGCSVVTYGKFQAPINSDTPYGSFTTYELARPAIIGDSTYSGLVHCRICAN